MLKFVYKYPVPEPFFTFSFIDFIRNYEFQLEFLIYEEIKFEVSFSVATIYEYRFAFFSYSGQIKCRLFEKIVSCSDLHLNFGFTNNSQII